ncbi:MAG: hypothetical protein V4750_02745 [Pseudomonadota bacterium]
MTPGEIVAYARQRYNATADTRFFTESELYTLIWDAQMQLARETDCIRSTYTTTTVASQQEYSYPTSTLKIKRITYNSQRVDPRSLQEVLDMTSSVASPTGAPTFYALWNETIYLGPTPAEAQTLKIFSVNEPTEVSSTSVLDVPSRYHLDIGDYLLAQMATKDKNYEGAEVHLQRWRETVQRAKAFERKMMRGDGLAFVRDVDRDVDSWVIPR